MGRTAGIILACIFGLTLVVMTTPAQEDITEIDASVFKNPERPASIFQHDIHNETAMIEECNECHHLYEDGVRSEFESSEDQYCSDCHGLTEASDGKLPLMKAFHTNCKGCHLDRKAGPIMCGECHVKESRR